MKLQSNGQHCRSCSQTGPGLQVHDPGFDLGLCNVPTFGSAVRRSSGVIALPQSNAARKTATAAGHTVGQCSRSARHNVLCDAGVVGGPPMTDASSASSEHCKLEVEFAKPAPVHRKRMPATVATLRAASSSRTMLTKLCSTSRGMVCSQSASPLPLSGMRSVSLLTAGPSKAAWSEHDAAKAKILLKKAKARKVREKPLKPPKPTLPPLLLQCVHHNSLVLGLVQSLRRILRCQSTNSSPETRSLLGSESAFDVQEAASQEEAAPSVPVERSANVLVEAEAVIMSVSGMEHGEPVEATEVVQTEEPIQPILSPQVIDQSTREVGASE